MGDTKVCNPIAFFLHKNVLTLIAFCKKPKYFVPIVMKALTESKSSNQQQYNLLASLREIVSSSAQVGVCLEFEVERWINVLFLKGRLAS